MLVHPVTLAELRKGDVVLCKVRSRVYLHLVCAIKDGLVQIGSNRGSINGWTGVVYGRATEV